MHSVSMVASWPPCLGPCPAVRAAKPGRRIQPRLNAGTAGPDNRSSLILPSACRLAPQRTLQLIVPLSYPPKGALASRCLGRPVTRPTVTHRQKPTNREVGVGRAQNSDNSKSRRTITMSRAQTFAPVCPWCVHQLRKGLGVLEAVFGFMAVFLCSRILGLGPFLSQETCIPQYP